MTTFPVNVTIVASAVVMLGDEADLKDIYLKVGELVPNWEELYRDVESFRGTIRNTIESYCPQSQNWDGSREAMFEKVRKGRYRVVLPADRLRVIARGRSL
jgi:hypothetical protein